MSRFNIFRKKTTKKGADVALDPADMPQPTDVQGYLRRGWVYHGKGLRAEAEADFRKALELDVNSVDANYALGLELKAQSNRSQAVGYFQKAVDLIQKGGLSDDQNRAEMLRRLALAQVNELTSGDWNLEEVVWHHKS